MRVLGPPLRGGPPFFCFSILLSQYRKTADRVAWGMLPRKILESGASEITGNAFQSSEKFVKFFNRKIKINNNNDINKLFLVGLQPTQPHSSAVPVLNAQTGNEKVP